jgi:hypothetical protein
MPEEEAAMMSLVVASLTLALSLPQSTTVPQPDFSGTWTMDRSRSQSPDANTLKITQNPTEITIETQSGGKTSTRTFAFEASKHPASETLSAGHSHASWDGTILVNEAVGSISGQTVSYRQLRYLNAAATEMTVESVTIVQHGYSVRGGKNYTTAKDVYVRSQ